MHVFVSKNWWSCYLVVRQTFNLQVNWDAVKLKWRRYNGLHSENKVKWTYFNGFHATDLEYFNAIKLT